MIRVHNSSRWHTADLRALFRRAALHFGVKPTFWVRVREARRQNGTMWVFYGKVESYYDPFEDCMATYTEQGPGFNLGIPKPETFLPASAYPAPRTMAPRALLALCTSVRMALLVLRGARFGDLTPEQRLGYTELPEWATSLRARKKRRSRSDADSSPTR